MKHYGEDVDNARNNNRVSNFMSREETRRLDKAKKWRENYLLKMMLLFVTLPLAVFSLIAFSIPYLYVFVPVY